MTPDQAASVIEAVRIQTGWNIVVVTRDDVAAKWYPDVDDAVMTNQQWSAVKSTQPWDEFDMNESMLAAVDAMIEEAIFDAQETLMERIHDHN